MRSPTPTVSDFDELLGYLPALYASDLSPVRRWHGGVSNKNDDGIATLPWAEYQESVTQFFSAAAKACWYDHDYTSKHIDKVISDSNRVASATLEEIKSMLTWCVRGERFCDGYWATVIERGYIRNILQRLQALRPR